MQKRRSSSERQTIVVKHVVMFGVRPGTDMESIQSSLLALPNSIPQILDYELGVDLQLPAGQSHPAGPNRSLAWSVTFATTEDYQVYDRHSAHQEVVGRIKEVMIPGTRAAIQFETMAKES